MHRAIHAFMFLLAVATALLLAVPGYAGAESVATAGDKDTWYVVRFSGVPVGFGKDQWKVEDGEQYYMTYLEIKAARLGTPIEMVSQAEEWNDAEGRLIRFRSELYMSDNQMEVSGELVGDTIHITTESHRFTHTSSIAWEEGALGGAAVDGEVTTRLRDGETDFSLRIFDAQNGGFRTSRFVVRERVETTAGKKTGEFLLVDQFDDGGVVPYMTFWVDGEYKVQKMSLQQMGAEIVIEVVDAEDIATLELDPNFDIIRASTIQCTGFPRGKQNLSTVTYRLSFTTPVPDTDAFNGPNQRVARAGRGSVDIVVSREPIASDDPDEAQIAAYLRSARYVQSDNAAIVAIADSIAGATGASGLELAEAIAEWVNGYIVHKNFGQGFSSAVDVLATREGDCTEHSVLLAAILRAAGIPARVASGLAYADNSLAGHMWTEVYVDKWRTLDALDLSTSPIRIRLTVSSDEHAMAETALVNAYAIVAGLHAEIVDYTTDDG